jgi:hypothetical protein
MVREREMERKIVREMRGYRDIGRKAHIEIKCKL